MVLGRTHFEIAEIGTCHLCKSEHVIFGAGLSEALDRGIAGRRIAGRVEQDRSVAGESVLAEPWREDQLLASCGVRS